MSLEAVSVASSFEVISQHVVFWSVYDPSIKTEMTSCGIRTHDGWYLIDPAPIHIPCLDQLPVQQNIKGILLTNENHERFSIELAGKKKCPVWIHESERQADSIQPKSYFKDGFCWSDAIQAIFIPGASKSETIFYSKTEKVAVIGDALINLDETGFQFLPDKYCHNAVKAKTSVKRLFEKPVETLLFAHGRPLRSNIHGLLKELYSEHSA